MDITNDGRDDRELIKSRIRASGGKVVFEAFPDGKTAVAPQTSGMDSNTVFVVLGADVVLAGDNPTKDQLDRAERYKKYINEAKILGIPQITANKLMGYLKVLAIRALCRWVRSCVAPILSHAQKMV